jgi:hypothetical protein
MIRAYVSEFFYGLGIALLMSPFCFGLWVASLTVRWP